MGRVHQAQRGLLRELTAAEGLPGREPAASGGPASGNPALERRSRDPERHVRQARFAPFGAEGQSRLSRAHALVVGVGALGTHVAQTLARAGIGRLTLVDRDVVDRSNLQRQVLFDDRDASLGSPKASTAAAALRRIDPELEIVALDTEFDTRTWQDLDRRPDVILDGTDNFATRFTLNALALEHGIPWIHAAAVGSEGRAMVVRPGRDPCFRCLLPDVPEEGPNCDTLGVLAPAVAHVAGFQAGESLKLLGGHTDAVTRGLFVVDVWAGRYELLFQDAGPRPDCPACGRSNVTTTVPSAPSNGDDPTGDTMTSLCGRDAVQVRRDPPRALDLVGTSKKLADAGYTVTSLGGRALRVEVEGLRATLFPEGRTLVLGTDDPERARHVHRQLLGIAVEE